MAPDSFQNDGALLAAAAAADPQALGGLFDRYGAVLLSVAQVLLRDPAAAEDLVHDVLVEAWRKAGSYDPDRGSVRTWLLVRLRSRALDRLRAPAHARRVALDDLPPGLVDPLSTDDPGRGVEHQRLRAAVHALPAAQREVLLLAYFGGQSAGAISAQLGIPVGTVKSRLATAVRSLRAQLGPLGGGS